MSHKKDDIVNISNPAIPAEHKELVGNFNGNQHLNMDFNNGLLREFRSEESRLQQKLVDQANEIVKCDDAGFKNLLSKESHRIVSIQSIKNICLKYRLRFLEFKYFKGEIPIEAKAEMERLKAEYRIKTDSLKIIAPGELFKLENREKDPILLAELADGRYVIIYKWGSEFKWTRVLKVLPMRNVLTMATSILFIAFLFSLMLISFAGGTTLGIKEFLFGFGIVWMGFLSYATFLALSQNVFPSSLIWNSKFLD